MSKLRTNQIETLDGKGEGLISYPYEAGLVINSHNIIVRDGDDDYKLSLSTPVPYITTGAGLPEDGAFVSVGDAELRQELAAGVDTGQGASLVNGATIYIGSVTELEALSLDVGVNVHLTEDGRAGEGVIKSGSHAADPRNGFYIDLPNGNYWERLEKYPTKLSWFGVVYDDDAVDNKANIEDCISLTHLIDAGRGDLYTSPILLKSNLEIRGAGKNETRFLNFEDDGTGTEGGSLEILYTESTKNYKNIKLSGFCLDGRKDSRPTAPADQPQESHTLMLLENIDNLTLTDFCLQRHSTNAAGPIRGIGTVINCKNVHISDFVLRWGTVEGLTCRNIERLSVWDGNIDGTNGAGIIQMSSGYNFLGDNRNVITRNILIKNTKGSGCNNNGSGVILENIIIDNCGNNGIDSSEGFDEGYVNEKLVIRGCKITNVGKRGIHFYAKMGTVADNIIDSAAVGININAPEGVSQSETWCTVHGNNISNVFDTGAPTTYTGIGIVVEGRRSFLDPFEVYNCAITNNVIGGVVELYGISLVDMAGGLSLTNNVVYGEQIGIRLTQGGPSTGVISSNIVTNNSESFGAIRLEKNNPTSIIVSANVSNSLSFFFDIIVTSSATSGYSLIGNYGRVSSLGPATLFDSSNRFDQGERYPTQVGPYYLWVDSSSRLRVKNGAPTSNTDGTVVGTQT